MSSDGWKKVSSDGKKVLTEIAIFVVCTATMNNSSVLNAMTFVVVEKGKQHKTVPQLLLYRFLRKIFSRNALLKSEKCVLNRKDN